MPKNIDVILKDDNKNNLYPLAHKDSSQRVISEYYASKETVEDLPVKREDLVSSLFSDDSSVNVSYEEITNVINNTTILTINDNGIESTNSKITGTSESNVCKTNTFSVKNGDNSDYISFGIQIVNIWSTEEPPGNEDDGEEYGGE